jgi:Abscisic acid G-protein coupled receptor
LICTVYSHFYFNGQSVKNILTPARSQNSSSSTYPDLITHLLAYVIAIFPSSDVELEDVAVLSRQISLVLVGIIILSSIRLVLRGVMKVKIR